MRPGKLSEEEAQILKKKPFFINKHVMTRELRRLRFRRVEEVFASGEIFQEGKRKYRSVVPVKERKIAYVIFEEHPEFLEFKTCGVSARKRVWG